MFGPERNQRVIELKDNVLQLKGNLICNKTLFVIVKTFNVKPAKQQHVIKKQNFVFKYLLGRVNRYA